MKETTVKYPIILSIFLGLALVIMISIASAISMIFFEENTIALLLSQIVAFLLMAIILVLFMFKKDKTLKAFGFVKLETVNAKTVLYYLPLMLIIFIQPLMAGIDSQLNVLEIFLIIIQMILVGFVEEALFRGIYRYLFKNKSNLFYLLFSAFIFGILHLANGLAVGSDMFLVLLQIVNAFLIGIMLALVFLLGKSILPLIAFHTLFNILASIQKVTTSEFQFYIVAVLTLVYCIYISYLLIQGKKVKLLQRKKEVE